MCSKKKFLKRKISSSHSNVKETYRPWVRIRVLLRKILQKREEKKIYTAVTCKIGKRQATLQRFFFLMNGKLFYNSF